MSGADASPRRGLSPGACGRIATGIAFALTALGILMVYSTSTFVGADRFDDPYHFLKAQLVGTALGLGAFLFCSRLPYRFWAERSRSVYLVTLVLLVLVLFVGSRFNGARRWIRIGGVIGCQPSEYAKLAVVVFASALLTAGRVPIREFRRGFLKAVVPIVLLSVLVALEPDFGTALFLAALGTMVLLVGGLRVRHLALSAASLLPVATLLMIAKFEHVKHRLAFFFEGKVSYQVQQAFVALGSGGMFGRGIGAGKGKLFFLPEASGDFIFPAIGEETGFLGVVLVVLLFVAFAWCGLRIARAALETDRFAFYLAVGITSWISLQALINLAVVSGSAPTKGIALPFVSFGTSSLICVLMGTGVLVGISRDVERRVRVDLLRPPR